MKTYLRADARSARILSVGDNRRLYQQGLNEAQQQETSKVAVARRRLEIHKTLEPVMMFSATVAVPRETWRATLALFNEAIDKLATGEPRGAAIPAPDRLAAPAETPGTLPDFRAGRDL
jgi:hypothetical protein